MKENLKLINKFLVYTNIYFALNTGMALCTKIPYHITRYLNAKHQVLINPEKSNAQKSSEITANYHKEAIFNPNVFEPRFSLDEKRNLIVTYVEPDKSVLIDPIIKWMKETKIW